MTLRSVFPEYGAGTGLCWQRRSSLEGFRKPYAERQPAVHLLRGNFQVFGSSADGWNFFFASGLLYIRWRGCCSERQGGFVSAEKQKEPFPGLPERFFPFLVLPAGAPDNPPVLPEEVPPLFQEVPVLQVHFRSRVHSLHLRRPEAPRHLRQNTLHCPLQRRPEVPERDLPRF